MSAVARVPPTGSRWSPRGRASSPPGCAVDWTQRLGGLTHGSRTARHRPDRRRTSRTLQEQWRYRPGACNGVTTGAQWFATPVTFHGVIYIGDDYGCLHAIDEATGHVLWTRFARLRAVDHLRPAARHRLEHQRRRTTAPATPVLYFHSPDGYLYKLRGSDGVDDLAVARADPVDAPRTTSTPGRARPSPTAR